MIYTCYCRYSATGEGMSYMILVGRFPTKVEAIKEFARLFGAYYTKGIEIYEGLKFDVEGRELLISNETMKSLEKNEHSGYFEYHSSYHLNLS